MADQKIELEITLDDGSVKKAFGVIRKEAEATEREVADTLSSLSNPIKAMGLNAYVDLASKALDATVYLANGMRDMMLEAEKVRVVNAQFAVITKQTGIATEQFNQAIMASIDGLIDDEDALDMANRAMVRLGLTAQRLPEIFTLARKASSAGFGDMTSNVEAFIYAIQTGNERALKNQVGLVVDLSKAQSDFAKRLGISTNQLTEQQKAYVNANAILGEAESKFGGVDGSIRKTSDSLARLTVALGNMREVGAVAFDNVFGGVIRSMIDRFTESTSLSLNMTKEVSMTQEKAAESASILRERIALLNKELMAPNTSAGGETGLDDRLQSLTIQLESAQKSLDELTAKFGASIRSIDTDPLAKRIAMYQEEAQAVSLNEQAKRNEMALSEARMVQYNQALLGFSQQENANRQANLDFMADQDQRQAEREVLYQDQLRQITEKGINDRRQIELNFSNEKQFTQEQRNQLEQAQIASQNQAILNAQQNFQMASQGAWGKYVQNAKSQLGDLGNYTKVALVQGMGGALASLGGALAKGEDAWVAFRNSFLGILGDIAINMGNMFIAMGIANQAIPIFGNITGGMAIAAGAALVVLGGLLKAFGGGASGASAMAGGGGVGAGASTSPEAPAFDATAPIGESAMRQPQTVVNFQVMGDILDSSDTQNRIVQLLNDAIDSKGAVVRGMA